MPYIISAINDAAGPSQHTCVTVKAALDKVLELEQQGCRKIAILNDRGRTISLDELSALYEASED